MIIITIIVLYCIVLYLFITKLFKDYKVWQWTYDNDDEHLIIGANNSVANRGWHRLRTSKNNNNKHMYNSHWENVLKF